MSTQIINPTGRAGLLAVALGQLRHTYTGLCPDVDNDFISRDPACPACNALEHDEDQVAWQEWGVVLDDVGSTDTYPTLREAADAQAAHGGDLIHIVAVAHQPTASNRPTTSAIVAALGDASTLDIAAVAAYAAAHQCTVEELDQDGDNVGVAQVREAIVAAIANR